MNYSRIVLRLRQRIFDYPPELDEKAGRVLEKAVARKIRQQKAIAPPERRGPYSGLTRRELAQTRTCEPDWF
jgi:hypothetical protein